MLKLSFSKIGGKMSSGDRFHGYPRALGLLVPRREILLGLLVTAVVLVRVLVKALGTCYSTGDSTGEQLWYW